MATLLSELPCVDPDLLYRECVARGLPTDRWWGRANRFRLTAGPEPGRGWLLLTGATLDALDRDAAHDLTFTGTDAGHRVTFSPITLLHSECVTPGGPGDPAAVHLCEVVDRRHHLARVWVPDGYKGYNVSTADGTAFQTATRNGGANWTWQGLVTDLATVLGIAPLTLPFAPHTQPENLIYTGRALDALCDACARLACALQYDPAADAFRVVRLGVGTDAPLTGLEGSALYTGRTWDGYAIEDPRGYRPEKIRVRFLRRPVPDATSGASPYYVRDVTLPAAKGVVAGTAEQLDDDLTALGATGAPSNAANLAARAQERADDWLRQRTGPDRPLVRAWSDIQPGAVAAVGRSVTSVTWDDRGADMRTWAVGGPSGGLERWRPLADYPPWWPVAVPAPASAKYVCKLATTGNITLSGTQTIDTRPASVGDAILVRAQTNASQNGVWIVQSGSWTRAPEFTTAADLNGAVISVMSGAFTAQFEQTLWLGSSQSLASIGFQHIGPYHLTGVYGNNTEYWSNRMKFEPSDGFGVSSPSLGFTVITIADATPTQAGIMGTGAQSFKGPKEFQDDVTVGNPVGAAGNLTVGNEVRCQGLLVYPAGLTGGNGTPGAIYRLSAFVNSTLGICGDGQFSGISVQTNGGGGAVGHLRISYNTPIYVYDFANPNGGDYGIYTTTLKKDHRFSNGILVKNQGAALGSSDGGTF